MHQLLHLFGTWAVISIYIPQQDYSEEGIPVKNFTFPDNRHILELFLAKNNGIFSVLEDESREPDGSDTSLSCKLSLRVTG